VKGKFSVVYTDFRATHPKFYWHINRSTLNHPYYYMFNKFNDKEDNYYLKCIFCPSRDVYGCVGKSPLTNNYQYYESEIDKHIK
jgi:hypothetical protein